VRRAWFPTSKSPRDRDGKRTAGLGTRLNHSGVDVGTLKNQAVSRRHGRGRGASIDDDAMKVIDSFLEMPLPTHRLLVVSTKVLFCLVAVQF